MTKPDKITPVSQGDGHFKLCVYAEPGVGKTVLAGTSPNALIIRPPTDHTDSIVTQGLSADEWVVRDWSDMAEVHEYLRHEGMKDYEWVWLDSISQFQDTGLDDVFADAVARKPSRGEFGPDKGEYGINMRRLQEWVRNVTAIPMNFGVTAHPDRTEDPDGEVVYMPYVQGRNMPQKICGYMNLVGRLAVIEKDGNEHRVLVTKRQGKFYGKDQILGGKSQVVNPTIPKLMKLAADARQRTAEGAKTKTAARRPAKKAATKRATRKA